MSTMSQKTKQGLYAFGRSEMIPALPVADRHEVVGQALATIAGATLPNLNPLAGDLLRSDTSLAGVMAALGGTVQGAVTSPDLASAISESLRHLTLEAIRTRDLSHRAICRMITLPNFRQQVVPWPQPVTLAEVGEGEEIPTVTSGVSWEPTAQIKTFAGTLAFTREAVINADWPLLGTIAEELVDAAYRAEREAVFGLLTTNPALGDGVAWFDPSRSNIASTTGAPSVSTLESAISTLRRLGENGVALGLRPAFVVVPDNLEVATSILMEAGARLVFSAERPALADPGLTNDWFVLPSPQVRPVIGLAHLPRATEPMVDLRPKFSSDAIHIRCRHAFGVAPLSPFAVKVPGL